jgi:hypothetical protein
MALAIRRLLSAALLALFVLGAAGEPTDAQTSGVIRTCYKRRPAKRGFRTHGNLRPLFPGKRCGPRENFFS